MSDWRDDAPDVALYVKRNIKAARKEHICSICRETIQKGQPYKRTSYVEDGVFGVYKEHKGTCPKYRKSGGQDDY